MITAPQRYNIIAIILHWLMAIAFLLMLASGLAMEYATMEKADQFALFQWHKSLGVLLLCAFVLRIIVRLAAKHPTWPATMKPVEQKAAAFGHFLLYCCMFAVPVAGWVMVSSSPFGLPTIIFGWFEWPHVPGIAGNEPVQQAASFAHKWLAYGFAALIVGHVAAVIKHALIDHENLLPRMGIGRTSKGKES